MLYEPTAAKYFLPLRWQILQKIFLKLLIGSHLVIEESSLKCCMRCQHSSINLDNTRNSFFQNLPPLRVKGIFTADVMLYDLNV